MKIIRIDHDNTHLQLDPTQSYMIVNPFEFKLMGVVGEILYLRRDGVSVTYSPSIYDLDGNRYDYYNIIPYPFIVMGASSINFGYF